MNNRQKSIYRRSLVKAASATENKYAPLMETALSKQFEQFFGYAEKMGLPAALNLIDTVVTNDPVTVVMQSLYNVEGRRFAQDHRNRLNELYGAEYDKQFGKQKALDFIGNWLSGIADFFNTYGFTQVVRITETTREYLRKKAADGLARQLTIPQLRDELITAAINRARANVIVRTETQTVLNQSNRSAAKASRLLYIKEWSAIHDKRTRHSHVLLDGQQQSMDAPYTNGGLYPGDPSLPASERIQCRCVELHIAARDANGRLIRA